MYNNPPVLAEIRLRANAGRVIFTDHARDRAAEREVDDADILKCLKTGVLFGEDWDAKHQATVFRMRLGPSQASHLIVCVALEDGSDIVVTVIRRD